MSSGELLSVLEYIEREKGIERSILIETVESALMSAAKKSFKTADTEAIEVKLDPETGDIAVFVEGAEVASEDFGRIAAQTAKQVIIQKIREAERSVIYDEYQEKVGEIVTGGVHRFERGDIIVDLGRTEAVFPKKEQVFREEYRQGNRIRAMVVEVRQDVKGPQIVLSRRNANLVKKLFEMEVPEIYDGIVEIKSVAREPGDRTKIAVWSKDEKVDSVGACVGMRGSRVKNIVRELNGEKIDIVRWNDNVSEYVRAALSPAEISQIKVMDAKKKVEVLVEDDMLSLAIGKRGQNVRLASKLTGWEIVIQSRADEATKVSISVADIPGVGKKTAQALKDAGFGDVAALLDATDEQLATVPGVGKATLAKLKPGAQAILKEKIAAKKADPLAAAMKEQMAADEAANAKNADDSEEAVDETTEETEKE